MSNPFTEKVLKYVLAQVRADKQALDALPYAKWFNRVQKGVRSFVPDLISYAPDLRNEVKLTLNSPKLIRDAWRRINALLLDGGLPQNVINEASFLTSELERESYLFAKITGETVSSLISDFLCKIRPDIRENNRSTYPDLYFDWSDYDMLPKRTKSNPRGPALKGTRPTSVPDGVEVKSQRGKSIRVDCHHPHQGMHLVLTFDKVKHSWEVYDVYIAYLSGGDYRQAARNTTATTEKFSFGQAPFISVTDGSVKVISIKPSEECS
jgi:hypothetical protein